MFPNTLSMVSPPPFSLDVSAWDARFPPAHSRRILCFRLPEDSCREDARRVLINALRSTVEELPFLAGSVVPPPGYGVGHWQRVVESSGSAFVRFRDVSADLPAYDELAATGFPQHLLLQELLCPFPTLVHAGMEKVPICGLQANFVEGGVLLVVSIVNVVGDGRGISDMIEIFAKHARAVQSPSFSFDPKAKPDIKYQQDRRLLVSGFGAAGNIDKHPAWTAEKANAHTVLGETPTRRRNIRFTADSLKFLKVAASPDDGGWISTHDALVALIWRSIMTARYGAGVIKDPTAVTALTTAVDCRRHLGLPEPYFGVAIYAVKANMPLNHLDSPADTEKGLCAAAQQIRTKINSVTAEDMRDLVGYVERTGHERHTRLAVLYDMQTTGMLFISHWRFTSQALDFGPALGAVETVRHPDSVLMPGSPTLLPMAVDGSAEVMLNEREDVMELMLKDAFLMKYATVA